MKLYLSGPMTVHKDTDWGEALFKEGAEYLRHKGHTVWSPAEYDIEKFGSLAKAAEAGIKTLLRKDLDVLDTVEGIALLEGWEKSTVGVPVELLWAARVARIPVFVLDKRKENGLRPIDLDVRVAEKTDSVAREAADLVTGERRWAYGHPKENFEAMGRLWMAHLRNAILIRGPQQGLGSVTLGLAVEVLDACFDPVSDVAAMMICTKLARETNSTKRDNWTDIAGYAEAGYQGIKKRGD